MSLCLTHPPTSLTSRPFQNRRAARFTSIEPLCPVIHKCGVGPCTHAALKSRFATRRPSGHRNSEKKRSNVQALRKDVCDRTGVSRTLRTACQGGPGSGLNLKTEPSAAMTTSRVRWGIKELQMAGFEGPVLLRLRGLMHHGRCLAAAGASPRASVVSKTGRCERAVQ